jgi:integrase
VDGEDDGTKTSGGDANTEARAAAELAAPRWPVPFGASEHDRLAALDTLAGPYVASQRPANTLRSYADDWKVWEDYVADVGIPLLAGTAGALVGFVIWLEVTKQAAPSTIERRLTGAVAELKGLHARLDPQAQGAARQALNGYKRRLAKANVARGRGQATPINLSDLRAVARACPDTLAGHRDRALTLVGFAIAARCSDLAHLLVDDIADDPNGLFVTVRHGKTIGHSSIPGSHDPEVCPVRAWHTWTRAAGITGGPAFRRIDRHGTLYAVGLSPQAVNEILGRAGTRAGLRYPLTGHSLRSGMATETRRNGARDDAIADQGRWARGSRAMHEYFRRVDSWKDNALDGLL